MLVQEFNNHFERKDIVEVQSVTVVYILKQVLPFRMIYDPTYFESLDFDWVTFVLGFIFIFFHLCFVEILVDIDGGRAGYSYHFVVQGFENP